MDDRAMQKIMDKLLANKQLQTIIHTNQSVVDDDNVDEFQIHTVMDSMDDEQSVLEQDMSNMSTVSPFISWFTLKRIA